MNALPNRVKKIPSPRATGIPMKISANGTPTAMLTMVCMEMPFNSATNTPSTGSSTKACRPRLCQRVSGGCFGNLFMLGQGMKAKLTSEARTHGNGQTIRLCNELDNLKGDAGQEGLDINELSASRRLRVLSGSKSQDRSGRYAPSNCGRPRAVQRLLSRISKRHWSLPMLPISEPVPR